VTYFTEENRTENPLTGAELKRLREHLGEAIGRPLSVADMARLCGLEGREGADTIRKWEVTGPTGPVAELLRILAMASERYPILDMFNVFDRHDAPVKERPARRRAFREQMRSDVRRRIG
jgi:DNA-binding transcriptional regulator YiaG